MKEITFKAYQFDELSPEAKQKALEWARDINVEGYDWWEAVYEQWIEKLEKIGFMDPKIWFSGFCSQGDGACFDCKEIDIAKWLEECSRWKDYESIRKLIEEKDIYGGTGKTSYANHYSHSRTRYVELQAQSDMTKEHIEKMDELEKEIEAHREYMSDLIYKALQKEYEHLTSDECVIEMIEGNEYDFSEDGSRTVVLN